MAKCKNCGHNSAMHYDQTGKPNRCVQCKEEHEKCKGWKE